MKSEWLNMKRALIFVFVSILLLIPALSSAQDAKPLEASVTFDWISKSQLQRDKNISEIKNKLFTEETVTRYDKKQFRSNYSAYLKNKNYLTDYDEVLKGKKEDSEKYYCGFYFRKLLVAYGIQYKQPQPARLPLESKENANIYYYDALGTLRWIDTFSSSYPNFPYWSYQYDRNGKMVAAFYCLSDYDQYIFSPDKKFLGRWYKDKMYNKNAKVIMTRSNYGQDE